MINEFVMLENKSVSDTREVDSQVSDLVKNFLSTSAKPEERVFLKFSLEDGWKCEIRS